MSSFKITKVRELLARYGTIHCLSNGHEFALGSSGPQGYLLVRYGKCEVKVHKEYHGTGDSNHNLAFPYRNDIKGEIYEQHAYATLLQYGTSGGDKREHLVKIDCETGDMTVLATSKQIHNLTCAECACGYAHQLENSKSQHQEHKDYLYYMLTGSGDVRIVAVGCEGTIVADLSVGNVFEYVDHLCGDVWVMKNPTEKRLAFVSSKGDIINTFPTTNAVEAVEITRNNRLIIREKPSAGSTVPIITEYSFKQKRQPECAVCLEPVKKFKHILLPCAHMNTCGTCATKLINMIAGGTSEGSPRDVGEHSDHATADSRAEESKHEEESKHAEESKHKEESKQQQVTCPVCKTPVKEVKKVYLG